MSAGPSIFVERLASHTPLFSICIPQHNRTSFFLALLGSIREQTFRDLEVCVSDGGSDDGRHAEVLEAMRATQLPFRYARSEANRAYDANLRSSIALARGRYVLLFGNDDALATREVLRMLASAVGAWGLPSVVLTNYLELRSGAVMRRVRKRGHLGAGPEVALAHFRNFSFVSGILLDREQAQRFTTAKWDGSEMYQMYLGCRILAAGGHLFGMDEVLVHKDIQISGECAESYARKPRPKTRWIQEMRSPLCQYGRVAFDAMAPYLTSGERRRYAREILRQVLTFTYLPGWWSTGGSKPGDSPRAWPWACGPGTFRSPWNWVGSPSVVWGACIGR